MPALSDFRPDAGADDGARPCPHARARGPTESARRGPGGVPILVCAGHVGLSFGTCRGGASVARVDALGVRPRHASTVAVGLGCVRYNFQSRTDGGRSGDVHILLLEYDSSKDTVTGGAQ